MAFTLNAQVYVLNNEDEGGDPVVPGIYDASEAATWFSSPFTTADGQTVPDTEGGLMDYLFDDNQATHWHSRWEDGNQPNGVHYLRVDFPEGFFEDNEDQFPGGWGFGFGRRSDAGWDHVTKISVWGIPANLVEAENGTKKTYTKDDLDYIGEFEWTYVNNTEWRYSGVISEMGYNSICLFEEATTPGNRGYWHLGEFRIYGTVEGEEIDPRLEAIEALQVAADGCSEFNTEDAREAWFNERVGTKRGQYDETLANKYAEAYDAANEILQDWIALDIESEYTLDQINAAKKALEDAKSACLAKTAPAQQLTVAPGYYMIVSSLDFQGTYTETAYYTADEAEAYNEEHAEEIGEGEMEPVNEGDPYERTVSGSIIKSIYNNGGKASWKTYEEKAAYLFRIEKGEFKTDATHRIYPGTDPNNVYKVTNMQNGSTFGDIAQSAKVNFIEAGDSVFAFDIIPDAFVDGNQVINIRNAGKVGETGYNNIHCEGHGGGTGVSGDIVGWSWSAGASQWYLKPVTDDEAEVWLDADENKAQMMLIDANPIVAKVPGQIEIAKDLKATVHEDEPIITDGSQFYSPQTDLDDQDTTEEEVYASLISEETGTPHWHSTWRGGNVAQDVHYLQVADVDCGNFALKITRRNVQNDHVTKLRVKGYNDDDENLTFADGADLGVLNIPYTQGGETVTSTNVVDATGYSVLRFYSEEEKSNTPSWNNRGYWHVVKFQMYAAEVGYYHGEAEKTQYAHRKKLADAVTAAVEAWNESAWTSEEFAEGYTPAEGKELRNIEDMKAQYETLKSAYEAWAAVYADPTALRETVANAKSDVDMVVIGTNPGEWAEGASTLKTAYDAAIAYDEACEFNGQEELDAYITAITEGKTADLAAAIKITPNKWYKLHFAEEALYDQTGWSKTGANAYYTKYNDEQDEAAGEGADDVIISPALFGKYIAAGKNETRYVDEEGTPYEVIRHYGSTHELAGEEYTDTVQVYRPRLDDESLNVGSNLIFTDEDAGDAGLFRFVAATDSTYYIQNKATGLYLGKNSSNKVVLSLSPMTFNTEAIGYGASVINSYFISGEKHQPIHAELSTNLLVTWNVRTLGSNSMLFIEDANIEGEPGWVDLSMKMWPGELYGFTFPVKVMFDPDKVEVFDRAGFEVVTDDDAKIYNNTVVLAKAEGTQVEAGTPVIVRTLDEYPGSRTELLNAAKAQWLEDEGAEGVTRQFQKEKTEEFDEEHYVIVDMILDADTAFISKLPEAKTMLTGAFGTVKVPEGTTSVCPVDNTVRRANADVFESFIAVPTDKIETGAKYKWNWRIGEVDTAKKGDLNGDDELDVKDLDLIIDAINGAEVKGSDLNGDGVIDVKDLDLMIDAINGKDI